MRSSLSSKSKNSFDTEEAVHNFCEYLRIPSVHPNVNYDKCVQFLQKQAKSLDLPIEVHNVVPKKPVVILTWVGSEPCLPSILLNSHMDVVPVYEDKWKYEPFSAYIDEHNNIYARGSQDMKSVDEEIGGTDGMNEFVRTKAFKDLNVGVVLDEGYPSSTDEFILYYGERFMWHFHIRCPGNTGHGSFLLENTAGEKVANILSKVYEFRKQQIQILEDNPNLMTSDVTTINLTGMRGGVQTNELPPELILTFDCRIPPTSDVKKWEETIGQWCKDAGPDICVQFDLKQSPVTPTKLDNSNIYWLAFKEATDKLGLKLKPQISMGGTDARYIRDLGIPGLGFSPMNNTPPLLHNHNEYLNADIFLKGIEIYYNILISMGNKTE